MSAQVEVSIRQALTGTVMGICGDRESNLGRGMSLDEVSLPEIY